MRHPHPTFLQHTLANWLQSLIDQQVSSGHSQLPPLRLLAKSAGVSYPTMQRALKSLVCQGILTARQGSGVTINALAGVSRPLPASQAPYTSAELGKHLALQILGGRWSGDELFPSSKELCDQYGVSRRRLRETLRGLVAEGYLRPMKRTHRVAPASIRPGSRSVALVLRGGPDNEVVYPSVRSLDNIRSLEIECTRAGVQLVLVTADPIHGRWGFPGGDDWVLYRPHCGAGLLGYLVWTSAIDDRMLAELAPMISAGRCPIAVFDEGNEAPRMRSYLPRTSAHFLTAHSPESGRHAGRLLLRLGHRRVGWLSVAGQAHWSAIRRTGLYDEYQAAGLTRAIVDLPRRDLQPSEGAGAEVAAAVSLLEKSRQHRRVAQVAGMIRSNAETIRVMTDRDMRVRQFGPMLEEAYHASKAHGCTAWVAESDELAVSALAFLRGRGIAVPQDMSVIGFDNSREATEQSLTSYSFNGPSYMHAMLRYVLDTAPLLAKNRGMPVEFDGFMVERTTTAAARGGTVL